MRGKEAGVLLLRRERREAAHQPVLEGARLAWIVLEALVVAVEGRAVLDAAAGAEMYLAETAIGIGAVPGMNASLGAWRHSSRQACWITGAAMPYL